MVDHCVDTIRFIDVLYPTGRNSIILSDDVDPHLFQQCHFTLKSSFYYVVGLLPQTVGIVRANGKVVPVHSLHEERLAVNGQPAPQGVTDNLYPALGKTREREEQNSQNRHYLPQHHVNLSV